VEEEDLVEEQGEELDVASKPFLNSFFSKRKPQRTFISIEINSVEFSCFQFRWVWFTTDRYYIGSLRKCTVKEKILFNLCSRGGIFTKIFLSLKLDSFCKTSLLSIC